MKKVFGSALVVAACLMAGACGKSVGLSSIDIAVQAVMFRLSPHSATNWGGYGGYAAFVDAGGNAALLETTAMDVGTVSWTNYGIFFSDTEFDYLIRTDGANLVQVSPKTDYQDGLVHLGEGRWAGAYNHGISEDGYDTQVIVTSAAGASRGRAFNWYPLLGGCSGELFGITERYTDDERGESVLSQLYSPSDGIAEIELAGMAAIFNNTGLGNASAPCQQSELVFLATTYLYPHEDELVYLLHEAAKFSGCAVNYSGFNRGCITVQRWNVNTGALSVAALVSENMSGDFLFSSDHNGRYNHSTLVGDELIWIHNEGKVLASDIYTGATRMISEGLGGGFIDVFPYVVENELWLAKTSLYKNRAGFHQVEVAVIDLESGNFIGDTRMLEFRTPNSADNIIRGFAINPDAAVRDAFLGREVAS